MVDFHIDVELDLFLFSGYIDHSARVMRVITWSKPSKNTPNADGNNDIDKDEWETHATVLDKLLAWEKKLYDEVKVCLTFHLMPIHLLFSLLFFIFIFKYC